jgi:hypothetical protein
VAKTTYTIKIQTLSQILVPEEPAITGS